MRHATAPFSYSSEFVNATKGRVLPTRPESDVKGMFPIPINTSQWEQSMIGFALQSKTLSSSDVSHSEKSIPRGLDQRGF